MCGVAVPVQGLANVSRIHAFNSHVCAIAQGQVYCWGYNNYGQLGDATTTTRYAPILVQGLGADAVEIVTNYDSTCALLTTGAVKCWGRGTESQRGNGASVNSTLPVTVGSLPANIVENSGLTYNVCARSTAGNISCWGCNTSGELGNGSTTASNIPVTVTGVSGASALFSGPSHTCAFLADGALNCWGLKSSSQLGDKTTTN